MSSIQLDVPEQIYGRAEYFMPEKIAVWFRERRLEYSYVGHSSWGAGEKSEGYYKIMGATEFDAVFLRLVFPGCKVHYFE